MLACNHHDELVKAELTYNLWQINHFSRVLKQSFCNNEPSCQWFFSLVFDYLGQDLFQIYRIIVLVPVDIASADLHALADGIVDSLVSNDDVSSLTERRDDAGRGRECLRVENTGGRPKESRNVRFNLHMNILSSVEAGRSAWSNTICAQCLNCLLFQILIGHKVVEVIGGKIDHCPAVGQLRLRPRWPIVYMN